MKNWILQTTESHLLHGSSSVHSIAALAAIMALAVLIPITQYRILYGISVGYAASMLVAAVVLWDTFRPDPYILASLLTANVIVYGIRLSLYLLIRDWTGWKPKGFGPGMQLSRVRRVPFSIALAALYALMVSPLWYVLQGTSVATEDDKQHFSRAYVLLLGLAVSCVGNLMETVADLQKYVAKQGRSPKVFHGPTRGFYRITRHPNYTGEVLVYFGLFLAGIPFYDRAGWIASSIGLASIVGIMKSSTKRLEQRHKENYGGQKNFEQWRHTVTSPLFPFCKTY